ncbi:gas vesicle protein GvpG [Microcoleus sp. FACHB-1515]|uniref:gas vesicle protein GvpG n=1 Tax=Cyanophyceae TaxID=3028117 RepID=UPI0016860341|nr:gas vesicle protein GvpG [Microcoleus sp. FACHB-1515]MBD2091759.1 gas vesicle protein GvpG [Microcoleus sp. FACHB-1515]
MIFDLILAPIAAPINGLSWIGEKILESASAELDEKENLSKQLLALQLAFDLGEIPEDEFEAQEEALLLAMAELADREKS